MASREIENVRALLKRRRQDIIADHAKMSEPYRLRVAEVEHALSLLDSLETLPELDGTFVPSETQKES